MELKGTLDKFRYIACIRYIINNIIIIIINFFSYKKNTLSFRRAGVCSSHGEIHRFRRNAVE